MRIELDIIKELEFRKTVRSWHRLPRDAVSSPSLEVFKTRLDGVWRNLVWWKVFLPQVGSWKFMIFKVPTNANHSMTL